VAVLEREGTVVFLVKMRRVEFKYLGDWLCKRYIRNPSRPTIRNLQVYVATSEEHKIFFHSLGLIS
jgi:hypothetical protein